MSSAVLKSTRPKRNLRKAQAATDARLSHGFEAQTKAGTPGDWDYFSSVVQQTRLVHKVWKGPSTASKELEIEDTVDVTAYLQHIQRPGFIQKHGTLLLVEEKTFRILAIAENLWDYFYRGSYSEDPRDLLHENALTLFTATSAAHLEATCIVADVTLANPVSVKTANAERPLYAILHKIEEGIIVDLEPQWDSGGDDSWALDRHERASASIFKLQSTSDMGELCNSLVQEVKSLTGYDRVMLYKFHEDQHGEVIAEAKEDNLEPLVGLHYPANDVPQANRQLFVDVRLRMISDTQSGNVNILQHSSLQKPIPLARSTLRGVAGCHKEYCKSMGSLGTLVMAVVTNTGPNNARHLWGLVCCHHHSGPRAIAYPQRHACDFLIQAFALQLCLEMQAAAAMVEKRIMHMQAVLCGMLTRDAPLGLVRQTPSILDLVPADGALLMHAEEVYKLGLTPSEEQCRDLAKWLKEQSTESLVQGVFITNSLEMGGYPRAAELAPSVCGLAATMVSDRGDFLMWFRSGISKTIKWAGDRASHSVQEGTNMHPRRSFDAFLEVARQQSSPWEDPEVDAIQGLKLIVRDSLPIWGPQDLRMRIQTQLNQERLAIQNELVQVASELQQELEAAGTPIISLLGNGLVSEWNQKAAQLTNRPKEEVIGLDFALELLAEESREAFQQAVEQVKEQEELEAIDLCLLSRNRPENGVPQNVLGPLDRRVHLLVSLYAHHDAHGNLFGMRMVGQDITTLKLLNGEYVLPPEELRASLDESEVLVFAVDETGRVSEWNTAMERITSMPRSRVVGRRLIGEVLSSTPMLIVREPDSLVMLEVALCQALNGQDTRNHEFPFQTVDGKALDTLMHFISRKGEDGELQGATCFMQDITVRRAAENASAVRMVAEAAAQAKTMQLACLCHEIRNPLNGILSSISFMQDTDMTPEQSDLVGTTAACGTYLRRIVDDVLDLSKIEEGKLELEEEPFSLLQIVEAIIAQEASNAYEKGLQLFCTVDPACSQVTLLGDRLRVQQVVANFARNSVDYTPEGWMELKLKSAPAKRPGHFHFVFSVSDSGKGMTLEQQAEVFSLPSPVAHTEGSRNTAGGAGLGLLVCHKLAALMGATVTCSSELMVGSCFSLDLELPFVTSPREDPLEFKDRAKGVVYSSLGEWSSLNELTTVANAPDLLVPPSVIQALEQVHVQPGEARSPLGLQERSSSRLVTGVTGGTNVVEGSAGQRVAVVVNQGRPVIIPVGDSIDDEAYEAVGELEHAYNGRVVVQILREVVDPTEVAVLVGLEIVDAVTQTKSPLIQHWGSTKRTGSLAEALQQATRAALISSAKMLVLSSGSRLLRHSIPSQTPAHIHDS